MERVELREKIDKLAAFMETHTFKSIDAYEKIRLRRQLTVMKLYHDVLIDRIEAFPMENSGKILALEQQLLMKGGRMAEQDATDNESKPEKNEEADHRTNNDWFLQQLIRFVNADDMSFSLTLQVGGLIVSGTVISGNKYFQEFSDQFCTAIVNDEIRDDFRKYFSMNQDIYKGDRENNDNVPLPSFIHVRNARFYHPGGDPLPSNGGILWRGRIAEVDGFFLGAFGAPTQ